MATALTNLGHTVLHRDDQDRLRALCGEAESSAWEVRGPVGNCRVALFPGDGDALRRRWPANGGAAGGEHGLFSGSGDTQRVTIGLTYLWMAALKGGDHRTDGSAAGGGLRRLQRLEIKPQTRDLRRPDGLGRGCRPGRTIGSRDVTCGEAETLREALGLSLLISDHTPTDYQAKLNTARARSRSRRRKRHSRRGARCLQKRQSTTPSAMARGRLIPPSTTAYPAGLAQERLRC